MERKWTSGNDWRYIKIGVLRMIQIRRYKLGIAPVSMIIVFIIWSLCAVVAAFHQVKPEYPMPLSGLIVINEGMALLATLVYGILVHFAIAIVNSLKKWTSRDWEAIAFRWWGWPRKFLSRSLPDVLNSVLVFYILDHVSCMTDMDDFTSVTVKAAPEVIEELKMNRSSVSHHRKMSGAALDSAKPQWWHYWSWNPYACQSA